MKTYFGFARDRDWQVVIEHHHSDGPRGNSAELRNRRDLRDHSPDGFAWGYGGSGPAQLALSLLADALGDDERALRLYQPFKWKYIATIPQSADWAMSVEIVKILADIVEKEDQKIRLTLGRSDQSAPEPEPFKGRTKGIPMRNMRDFDKL